MQLGTNTIEAAKNAGVRYIVRSSAMGAAEKAITMGRLHGEVEKAVETSGIPYTILQPNTFMQSYMMNAENGPERSRLLFADGRWQSQRN